MLNPKGFLKKDLDQAVKLHDWFCYHVNRADVELGKGRFHDAKDSLRKAIKAVDRLDSIKKDKLLLDLQNEIDRQKEIQDRVKEENDRQSIVDKILRWRR